MTTFEKIIAAIEPFGFPHAPDVYRDKAPRWFTYNYADDYGTDFSDDNPGEVIVSVQVHLFLPIDDDFINLKNKVRRALFGQGFTFPEITVMTEDDEKLRHIIFECDIIEEGA